MPATESSVVTLTSSASLFSDKRDPYSEKHFRWNSIRKFIVLMNTFAGSFFTFDLFSSKSNKSPMRVFEYVLAQIFLGMGHLFMDSFIRQYTKKIDGYKFLSPLLSGVGYGQMWQTAFSSLLATQATADAIQYFIGLLKEDEAWVVCSTDTKDVCVSFSTILDRCNEGKQTNLNVTSVFFYYMDSFSAPDRNAVSRKFFVMGVIWMSVFTITTLTDDNIIKFLKLIFAFRTLSTIVVALALVINLRGLVIQAFRDIVVLETEWSVSGTITHMCYLYGIGYVPFYDFGAVSVYTMVDTAIILSSIYFTLFAFLRSWIFKTLYLNLIRCVKIHQYQPQHVLIFCILPLAAEFVRANKLYLLFLYINMILSTFGHVVLMTMSMAKILQSEFRSVKLVYFLGVISCIGFLLGVPIAMAMYKEGFHAMIYYGFSISLLYVGALKSMIIMWIYGVERFCTDINFWLGFKPTKFWKLTWALTPIVLVVAVFRIARKLVGDKKDRLHYKSIFAWIGFTVLIVAFFNIKMAIKFLVRNNLAGLFSASVKYGPPDPAERRNRRNFSETIALRRCKHNCQVVDDLFDCNHMPIMFRSFSMQSVESSTISLMGIYQADDKKMTSTTDLYRQ